MSTNLENNSTSLTGTTLLHTTIHPTEKSIFPQEKESPVSHPNLLSEKSRFTPLRELGEGNMGVVHLYFDNDIHRKVAVKRIKNIQNNNQLERFIREVHWAGRLDHPNIVPIHNVGKDAHGYFLIMKYIEGKTLGKIIQEMKEGNASLLEFFTFERRTQVFLQLLYAVQFAHEKGIIHRDIKPDNILLGEFGEVFLLDWGIGKNIENTEPEQKSEQLPLAHIANNLTNDQLIGTPAYMAPEQFTAIQTEVDQQSDVYSLCVVFYEFLTLKHPFEHKLGHFHELFFAVTTQQPKLASSVVCPVQHAVPVELAHFVKHGLQVEKQKRFQSVKQMIQRIQLIAEGHAPIECSATLLKRSFGSLFELIDRHHFLGIFTGIFFLLVFGIGLVQLFLWGWKSFYP